MKYIQVKYVCNVCGDERFVEIHERKQNETTEQYGAYVMEELARAHSTAKPKCRTHKLDVMSPVGTNGMGYSTEKVEKGGSDGKT